MSSDRPSRRKSWWSLTIHYRRKTCRLIYRGMRASIGCSQVGLSTLWSSSRLTKFQWTYRYRFHPRHLLWTGNGAKSFTLRLRKRNRELKGTRWIDPQTWFQWWLYCPEVESLWCCHDNNCLWTWSMRQFCWHLVRLQFCNSKSHRYILQLTGCCKCKSTDM